MAAAAPLPDARPCSREQGRLCAGSRQRPARGIRARCPLAVQHEGIEEIREPRMVLQGQDMRHMLVRPDDHHASAPTIDAAKVEDVLALHHDRAEHLLVVHEPVASLRRAQQGGHGAEGQLPVWLLEDRPQVDHRVDILSRRGAAPDRRSRILFQEPAERLDAG